MIEQTATVVSIDDEQIWLDVERQSSCSGCKLRNGCGTGLLSRHVGKRFSRLAVPRTENVQVGEQVQVQIAEKELLSGALMMYLLPLAGLIGGAGLVTMLSGPAWLEIASGLGGLAAGFVWLRHYFSHRQDSIQTQLTERKT